MEITLDRYYNRDKNNQTSSKYKELLFQAGDALQSAEMNEIQTSLRNDINNITKYFVLNGEFVSGGQVSTLLDDTGIFNANNEKIYNINIDCKSGKIFMNDYFIEIDETMLISLDQVLSTSDFKIGVEIKYEIVTFNEDELLKDPAVETSNFKQPGSGRLKISGKWVFETGYQEIENTEFLPLFRIKNGDIFNRFNFDEEYPDTKEIIVDTFEKNVTNICARYDRNANGNYLIKGYEVYFMNRVPELIDDFGTTDPSDDIYEINQLGPFNFSVADGNANVDGFNYKKDISQEITLEKLIDFELKQAEPIGFNGDGWYKIRHSPLRKVFRISGQRRESGSQIQHGSFIGAIDELPDSLQPVIEIESVWQNGSEASPDFINGVDYELDGDSVKWLDTGNEPSPGSTYFVTFRYQHTETEGNFESNNGDISSDYKSIYLQGFADGTTVNFDYDFVLKRIDIIFLNASGKLGYIKGVPHEDDPRAPELDKDNFLEICEVLLGEDFDPIVTQTSQKVYTMSNIQLLQEAIEQNEYNLTRLALQQNIQESQPGAVLKGMFVDSFENDEKRDLGLESLLEPPEYRGLTVGGNMIMNINWDTMILVPTEQLPDEKFSIEIPSNTNETPLLSQPHFTKFRKINEYLFKGPPRANLKIYPSIYKWVTETHYLNFIKEIQAPTKNINSFTTRFSLFGSGSTTTNSISREILSTTKNKTSSITRARKPYIIPRISLKLKSGTNFNESEQIQIFLDKKYVSTEQAINGKLDSVIIVPQNVISGSKEVEIKGLESGTIGKAIFEAEPLSRSIQTTSITTWREINTRTTWFDRDTGDGGDPVAQSFQLFENYAIDKIRIVFKELPTTDVSCILCETSAGFPDKNKTIGIKTLAPSELETVGTSQDFIFDNKIILSKEKEYAFIIMCDDATGAVQVAKLGDRTIDHPQKWMTSQAYSIGTLYNSSNNSAWSPIQKEDMRFWIYGCTFEDEYEYVYEDVNVGGITDLMILANSKVYEGANIKYRIELLDRNNSIEGPSVFIENSYSQIPLENSYSGRIKLTVLFTSDGRYTPVLDPNIQLAIGKSRRKSTSISTSFEFDYDAKKVVVLLDNYRPSNTTINCSFQVFSDTENNIFSWESLTQEATSTPLGNDWVESKFIFNWEDFKNDANNDGKHDTVNLQEKGKIRIDMFTANDKDRPVIGNLRLNTSNI